LFAFLTPEDLLVENTIGKTLDGKVEDSGAEQGKF